MSCVSPVEETAESAWTKLELKELARQRDYDGIEFKMVQNHADVDWFKTVANPVMDCIYDHDENTIEHAIYTMMSEYMPATKCYNDAIATGLNTKDSVCVATIEHLPPSIFYNNTITMESPLNQIDKVQINPGDRILVKDEMDGARNGVYVMVDCYQLTRATDFTCIEDFYVAYVYIEDGMHNKNSGWICTNPTDPKQPLQDEKINEKIKKKYKDLELYRYIYDIPPLETVSPCANFNPPIKKRTKLTGTSIKWVQFSGGA